MALAQQVWERSRDYVVFGALLLIGVVIFVSRNGPALRAARAASLAVTAPVEGVFARTDRFRQSLAENERLRTETAELSAEVARLREASAENAQLRALLQFEDSTHGPPRRRAASSPRTSRSRPTCSRSTSARATRSRSGCRSSTSAGSSGGWS